MLLQLLPSDRPSPPVCSPERDRQDEDTAPNPVRILVVEDEFLVSMEIESALMEEGFEIVGIANTADQAVCEALELRPDLVIMDIRLIGPRDGIDAATEIHRSAGIRSLFATAHRDAATMARAQAANPVGWLNKPYDRVTLLAAVRNGLQSLRDAGSA